MHRIDLSKKIDRLDLISDIEVDLNIDKIDKDGIIVERVKIDKKLSKRVNKSEGEYISIVFDDVTDYTMQNKVTSILKEEIINLLNSKNLLGKSCLIVGLGNVLSTPDSLGPKVIDNVIATRHLYEIGELDNNYSSVAKIAPGVFSITGIETCDIIKGITRIVKPGYIIVIDALSSTSVNKINKVIQITDSVVEPGSGVGNNRKEISKKTIGKDIIIIGVPTVVNLHTIVKDFLSEYDIDEILKEKGNNFMVTPKEIDFEIEKLSNIISNAINNSIHKMTK